MVLPGARPDDPGLTLVERFAAALAHLSLPLASPFLVPAVLLLVAGRASPFVRQHARSALVFQLALFGLLMPIVWLYYLTLGIYTLVLLVALPGGLCLAVVATVRALLGRDRPYLVHWLEPLVPPVPPPRARRVRRTWWALLGVAVVSGLRAHPAVMRLVQSLPGEIFNWVGHRLGYF